MNRCVLISITPTGILNKNNYDRPGEDESLRSITVTDDISEIRRASELALKRVV